MRVLVVQNYANTPLGLVGRALQEAGAEIDRRDAFAGDPLPQDASAHDALVALGGAQNALADDEYPYLPSLLELMRDFTRRDKAVLGICLGSQLIARAFGGRNDIGTAPEFGWTPVRATEEGASDAVLRAMGGGFAPFQWHDDTFSLPPGALLLATGDTVANQAFRIGRATYGVQFHFEADRTLVDGWSRDFADTIAARRPHWAGVHKDEEARHGAAADTAGLALARAWVATI